MDSAGERPPPSVSVVIPARNRETTIGYSIDSVLRQTVPPMEIIVVDDASTDNTSEAATVSGDARIRVIRLSQPSGAQAARNAGIHAATGEWIAFQDSDDEWAPEKLARQIRALEENNFDPWTLVHTNAVVMDGATGATRFHVVEPPHEPDAYKDFLRGLASPLFPTILTSRMALERIGYLDERVIAFQEWDTSIRLAKYCRVIYISDPLFIYHLHGGEMISKDGAKAVDGYGYIIDKFESEIRSICGTAAWNQHLLHQVVRSLDHGLWDKADGYLRRISSRSLRVRVLQICRYLHISPRLLLRFRRLLPAKA